MLLAPVLFPSDEDSPSVREQMVFSVSSILPAGRCSALTPLVLIPGDGPAAPGDLQWMLCPAPGHRPAPSGRGRGAPGAQQCALSLSVHRDHRTDHAPELVHGQVTRVDWKTPKTKSSPYTTV